MSATKVVIPCRISFANIFEPKSINGSEAKYSVSCLIPKDDKKTLLAVHKAIEAAKEDGKTRKWGGKIPPNLKMPLRDGDIDRPDDENYQEHTLRPMRRRRMKVKSQPSRKAWCSRCAGAVRSIN